MCLGMVTVPPTDFHMLDWPFTTVCITRIAIPTLWAFALVSAPTRPSWCLCTLRIESSPHCEIGVVYRISCKSCTKVCISHTLEHRLRERIRALVSGETNLSATTQHVVDEGHEIDWSSATVIDEHPNFCQWCALETWHIICSGPDACQYNWNEAEFLICHLYILLPKMCIEGLAHPHRRPDD